MGNKMSILYVDDESINLQLFKINFGQDYDIHTAENGALALECLDKVPDIQVIISDMKMPAMNGIEFITKANEKYPDKHYFIMTGYDLSQEIQDAIESGLIIRYFRKPFKIKEIESSIEQAIA